MLFFLDNVKLFKIVFKRVKDSIIDDMMACHSHKKSNFHICFDNYKKQLGCVACLLPVVHASFTMLYVAINQM